MLDHHTLRNACALPTASRIALVAVIVLALVMRLWFWWIQARSGAVPPGDPEEYYRAAIHILHGGYHDTGKWLRPPVYPAFLALLLPAVGMHVAGALLIQACILSVGALAFYAFGAHLFGRITGLVTALLAAIFIPLASYASSLYAEALFVTLLVAGLTALNNAIERKSGRMASGAGVILALAALTRAVGVYLIPLAAAWMVWRAWSNGYPVWRWRHPAILLLLGAMLVIGPWAGRNYLVHGRLIVSDTNGGISMWYGTVRDDAEQAAGEARLAAVPNLADRQTLALRMAWDIIREDPVRFLTRMRFKIASLYALQTRSYAVGDVISIDSRGMPLVQNAGEYSLALTLLADAQYVALMLLAIGGFCFMPQPARAVPTLLWVGLATLLAALTIGHPRLRLPIVAAVLPFAAYALIRLPVLWRQPARFLCDRRSYAALVGAVIFLAFIFSTRYISWIESLRYTVPGRAALAAGDVHPAGRLLTRAREVAPDNPLRVIDLADLYLAQGDNERALELYRLAASMEHRSLYAQAMRVLTAAALDNPAEAAAALRAIDDYWRSGNDLLEWAWNARHMSAPSHVIPGDPAALGFYAGFAPATPDLTVGRWTLGEGRVRVRGGCGRLEVRMHGPTGRVVDISLDDWNIHERVTLTGAPQEVRISLSGIRECEYNPELTVRFTSATGLLDLETAPWYGGVAITDVRVTP
ncbi:MAG: glycosyltransferase family 39 protein [Roseiflexus sp.]|uniref:glycosyltransferase family 39 protein n=1 Tax=Roseiflexus sp. TaxID=2562120 RepID=UPI0025E2FF8A|nr:glycosyltransferase family 39 protein [Roseiflexus sp.]MCL6540667.1 glycosyltransferase family 39 protein [Roseiflexus sp.]